MVGNFYGSKNEITYTEYDLVFFVFPWCFLWVFFFKIGMHLKKMGKQNMTQTLQIDTASFTKLLNEWGRKTDL